MNILIEGSVVGENIFAHTELHGEGGFPDFRRVQHPYCVKIPHVASFLSRFHVGELRAARDRAEKSEREKRGIKSKEGRLHARN